MKKYTTDEFLMAAGFAEVSMIDAKHIVQTLEEFYSDKKEDVSNSYDHLKQYLYDRNMLIDKELDSNKNDNPFLSAYYNGVKVELKAIEMVVDALIEKQNVLSKIGALS